MTGAIICNNCVWAPSRQSSKISEQKKKKNWQRIAGFETIFEISSFDSFSSSTPFSGPMTFHSIQFCIKLNPYSSAQTNSIVFIPNNWPGPVLRATLDKNAWMRLNNRKLNVGWSRGVEILSVSLPLLWAQMKFYLQILDNIFDKNIITVEKTIIYQCHIRMNVNVNIAYQHLAILERNKRAKLCL